MTTATIDAIDAAIFQYLAVEDLNMWINCLVELPMGAR
jgi:hypothetical protein